MVELKASTKRGQNIITRALRDEGYFLSEVYEHWSQQKDNAWKWCEHEFYCTQEGAGFHICSHNSFGFTCAWYGKHNDERIIRYETKENTYIVYLDR